MKIKLVCKNHRYISEGLGRKDKISNPFIYFPKLPFLIWHNIICPDNPVLHKLSNLIHKRYKPFSYKEQMEQWQKTEQIVITKKETLVP